MIEHLEEECWSLETVMADVLLPKLLYFKNWSNRYSYPSDLLPDEWEEILDAIIWAFTYISKGYPKVSDLIIKDIDISCDEKIRPGVVTSTIVLIYVEGKTEEDYNLAREQDRKNIARCQQGLNLFAQYYMSIWN